MKHELRCILERYGSTKLNAETARKFYIELDEFCDSLPGSARLETSSWNMVSVGAGVKKQELLAALKAEGFKDDIGHPLENNLLFQKLVSLIPEESAPDEGCGVGGVVPVIPAHEVQLVKMQTLHQLLVEQTSCRVSDAEGAEKLADLVNAAYDAINRQHNEPETYLVTGGETEGLDFSDALLWMKEGKRVTRKGFFYHSVRLTNIAGFVADRDDGEAQNWTPCTDDLLATSWRVVS